MYLIVLVMLILSFDLILGHKASASDDTEGNPVLLVSFL